MDEGPGDYPFLQNGYFNVFLRRGSIAASAQHV